MNMAQTSPGVRQPSLLRRVLFSTVGDLLRGRLTPHDPADDPLQTAALPEPLQQMVRDVTRRTRLWPSERAAVARELTAHFEDGLTSGAAVEDLRGSFGDPRYTARLIRRAKIRNRPLVWRVPVNVARGVCILVGALMVLYVFLAIWISFGTATLTQNYWKAYNAPVRAMADEERAWPLYRKAIFALEGAASKDLLKGDVTTARDDWDETVALLRQNTAALARFREAAARPHLGLLVSPQVDHELDAKYNSFTGWSRYPQPAAPSPDTIDDNPPIITMPLPPLAALRTASKLLWRDALLALEEGDADRMVADIDATLGIARQLSYDDAHLVTQLVSIAVAAGSFEFIQDQLVERPAALTNRQWLLLAHRVAAVRGGGRIRLTFEVERHMFYDILQRLYTEQGYPAHDFGPQMASLSSLSYSEYQGSSLYAPLTGPLAATFVADRAEMRAKYDELMDLTVAFADKPLWQRDADRTYDALVAISEPALTRWRYYPVAVLMPALGRAALLAELATQQRDVTTVAIALELYHREHGEWPATLADLTPRFLPSVPPDRFDGQPLKYRLVDGEPLLYSVGVDRDDDGGRLIPAEGRNFGLSPYERNKQAREWIPPATIEQWRGTEKEQQVDGDWLLWPRIRE